MIFCKNTIYARVWSVTKSDKYIDLRISTKEKDRDGNAVYSTWFPRVIGHAFNSIKDKINEGDTLVITKSKFVNESYEKDGVTKSAFRFLILEADVWEDTTSQTSTEEAAPAPASTPAPAAPATSDSCPW